MPLNQQVKSNSSRFQYNFYLHNLIRMLLPACILVSVMFYISYTREKEIIIKQTQAEQQYQLGLVAQRIHSVLRSLHADVRFLARSSVLQRWLNKADPTYKSIFTNELSAFAYTHPQYAQLRVLGPDGMELIRVDHNSTGVEVVSDSDLQNKYQRYYFQDTLQLEDDEVYLSSFDLNVEHGQIEIPYNPTLRLATKIWNPQGELKGVVIVNFSGNHILTLLEHPGVVDKRVNWMVNATGEYLRGPKPNLDWAFMFPEKGLRTFHDDFPSEWRWLVSAQQDESQSVFYQADDGLFVVESIHSTELFSNAETHAWYLIKYTSPAAIRTLLHERVLALTGIGIAILTAFFTLYLLLVRYDKRIQSVQLQRERRDKEFRHFIESAPDAIIIVSESGEIMVVNKQAENWFQYTADELVGLSVEVLVPHRFRHQHVDLRRGYTNKPSVRAMASSTELTALRKNGTEFPVEISLSPVSLDEKQVVHVAIRDISERKHLQKQRKQVEARFQDLVNSLLIGVFQLPVNKSAALIEANPYCIELLGCNGISQIRERAFKDFFRFTGDWENFYETLAKEGWVDRLQAVMVSAKGDQFIASITATMRERDSGTLIEGLVEDITQEKEQEEKIRSLNISLRKRSLALEASNKELEAFSYSVSHDLRAPLRAMDGFSEALLRDYSNSLDDKARDRLQRIRKAAQRMANLINDLLNLAKVSRIEMTYQEVDLSQLAIDVFNEISDIRQLAQVHYKVQPGMKAKGDPGLIRTVLENLIGNALKFSANKDKPDIQIGETEHDGATVFFVKDNGVGFDMRYYDKLFDTFQRLHSESEFVGTGVGLASVQRIITRHGGSIWANSEPEQGACFYFTFGEQVA